MVMFVLGACSSASGPSLDPDKSNCNTVCEQAQKCINSTLDVDDCTNNCDNKSSDDSYKNSVAACADCVVGKTCTDSTSCISNCLSAVTNF
jgi:hypothetical protein